MLRLAADENFNAGIVRGLVRRLPELDVVRIQDTGLSGADDPAVLEWAAREGRIVLTTTSLPGSAWPSSASLLGEFSQRILDVVIPARRHLIDRAARVR